MELDKNGIALGDTKEDKKQRKQFIKDFYQYWETKIRLKKYSINR